MPQSIQYSYMFYIMRSLGDQRTLTFILCVYVFIRVRLFKPFRIKFLCIVSFVYSIKRLTNKAMASITSNTSLRPTVVVASASTSKDEDEGRQLRFLIYR
ncbi:unnamed protein product [Rotaria socialis]